MAMNAQAEALRRKNAGDPRPIAEIIAEISASPDQEVSQAPQISPSPAQPVPVGQQVDIVPQAAAVPPMKTPFNLVEKAREAGKPKVAQIADTSATDVGINAARQKGDPNADIMSRVRAQNEADYRDMLREREEIRDKVGIPEQLKKIFDSQDKRADEKEAEIAADEKKQAWNALAMAGFQMAQSTSPYFLAALAAGMQSGLEGYNAAKAASAEKKARLMDARDSRELERYKAERAAEGEWISDMDAARSASYRQQEAMIKGLEAEMARELHPEKKRLLQAQISQIYNNMANDNARVDIARSAARDGSGRTTRVGRMEYDIKTEAGPDDKERQVLVPKGPGAVSLVEGPYGEWMPKRYADNPRALAGAKRAVGQAGGVAYEFDPSGDMWAVQPTGKKFRIVHRPNR